MGLETPESPPARVATARRRRRTRVIAGVTAVALVLVSAAAALYTLSLARTFDNNRIVLEEVFPQEELRPPAPEVPAGEAVPYNILLLGSDTRGKIGADLDRISGSRADSIMVVHVPADRDDVQVMSIMRDNWVPIEGHGEAKINAALAYGGVPLMVATVESFIGSRIDHVAVIDFAGFEGLTDALGGVTVDNALEFSVGADRFDAGPITLDGEDALTYVRERHSFADGDYQRARNQQAYLRGVLAGMLNKGTLTNPKRVYDVVDSISPFLTVDEGLDAQYVGALALGMRNLRAGDVRFFTSPTLGTGWEGRQSVVRPDWDAVDRLRVHFAEDTLADYDPDGA